MDFSNKIWQTRKIRINTEARLKKWASICDWILPFYSVNFIIITLYPFQETGVSRDLIQFTAVTGSLSILVISLILSKMNLHIRAHKMLNHYIYLDELYKRIIKAQTDVEKEIVITDYQKELRLVENHSASDYLITKISMRNDLESEIPKPVKIDYAIFIFQKLKNYLFIFFIFMVPIITDIILIYECSKINK